MTSIYIILPSFNSFILSCSTAIAYKHLNVSSFEISTFPWHNL
jgi:hypothetical protein